MLLDPQTLEITIITQILYVPYILKVYEHVAQVRNINNVVVNSLFYKKIERKKYENSFRLNECF